MILCAVFVPLYPNSLYNKTGKVRYVQLQTLS